VLDLTTFTAAPISQIPDANGIAVTPVIPLGGADSVTPLTPGQEDVLSYSAPLAC
jgi:hypothetical protein